MLEIIRMGHPTLRQVARPLADGEWNSPEIRQLVDDMVETLEAAGGIGLACLERISPVGVMGVGERNIHIRPSLSKHQIMPFIQPNDRCI